MSDTPVPSGRTGRQIAGLVLTGALFSLGCAYLGWTLGLSLFALAYEILRALELEAALESKALLAQIRTACWLAGLAGSAALFVLRCRTASALAAPARCRLIVLALGGVGATHLGYLFINGASVETMVATVFIFFVGGGLLLAAWHGGVRPFGTFVRRLLLGSAMSFAALFASLAFDKAVSQRYDSIGQERILWLRVEFPPDMPRAQPKDIGVTLRTQTQSVKCFAIAWENERESGRNFLPIRCDFSERTAERVVVIALPDRVPVEIRMPFARNPAPMHDYSPWQKSGALNFRYRVT